MARRPGTLPWPRLNRTAGTASADWHALGSRVRLVVTDPDHLDACRWLLARDLAEVDAACSRFREDSELVRLDAARGAPAPIGPLLAEALGVALRAAALTDGAVDPTVGSSLEALGYDRDFALVERDGRPAAIRVRPAPGWRRIDLDPAAGTVTVPRGVRLDLGATAKAWAADRAAAALAEAAGCGILVSLGGDTAVAGPPPAGGWQIRVQDITGHPGAAVEDAHAHIALTAGGLATSGTAARRWKRGGQDVHHIVDPRTGASVRTPWRTVTVAAATCADANAASTAALVKGAAAEPWLTRLGLPARLVTEDGDVRTTPGWPAGAEAAVAA